MSLNLNEQYVEKSIVHLMIRTPIQYFSVSAGSTKGNFWLQQKQIKESSGLINATHLLTQLKLSTGIAPVLIPDT